MENDRFDGEKMQGKAEETRVKEAPVGGERRMNKLETTGKKGKMVRQKPYVVAIVILTMLAVAGVGFGVTGMMMGMQKDGKAAKEGEVVKEDGAVANEEDTVENKTDEVAQGNALAAKNLLMRGNKVINWDDGERLAVIAASSNIDGGALGVHLSQQVAGSIVDCNTGAEKIQENDEFSLWVSVNWDTLKGWYGLERTINKTGYEDIEITNVDVDRVVDVLATGFGQATGQETILLLMDDGTIEYIPVAKAVKEGFRSYGKIAGVEDVVLMRSGMGLSSGCGGGLDAVAQRADGDLYDLYRALSAQGAWD